jgi:hypothetical protein
MNIERSKPMQSILITLPLRERDAFLEQIEEYHSDRDDVTLLRLGTTEQAGRTVGFLLIEFEEAPADSELLDQLAEMKPAVRYQVLDSQEEEGDDAEEEDDDA